MTECVSVSEMVNPLVELGLSKYEAKLYLTLIEEGISTAKNISDITGIPYGKVYEIINSLAQKGFCTMLASKPMKCQAISPKDAIVSIKEQTSKKLQKLEKHVLKELEPMFTESKKFIEPKGVFWIMNGRSNVVKKVDELIEKAQSNINIICSANSLSRLVLHKDLLQEAKDRGVKISVAGVITKENLEEIESLNFCDIRKVKNCENNLISIDNKECLVIEPIPDDDNIMYGRDLGVWATTKSFTKFMDDFFESNFRKTKNLFEAR